MTAILRGYRHAPVVDLMRGKSMKVFVVACALTALVSVGAEASVSNLFKALWQSATSADSGKSGDDSPGSNSGGNDSGSVGQSESGYTDCMKEVSASYDTRCMMTALADETIIPNYADLKTEAAGFASADGPLASYCSAIATPNESTAFSEAEAGWERLSAAVQRVEMHAIGPAVDNGFALQYRLNSYMSGPISTCGIDSFAASPGADVTSRAINTRGIRALDYLLFNPDLDHTCAPQVSSTQDWNDLTGDERRALRCDAAVAIASDISAAAEQIHSAWSADDGNYRATYLGASNVYQSLQATTDSMFYLEKGTKDAKLGHPLGIIVACPSLTCPDMVEAPYSENSLQNIITNLQIWSEMFSSNAQTGFDAHLENEGWPEVSQAFKTNLQAALQLAESIDTTVVSQVAAIKGEAQETECTNAYTNPDTVSEAFPMCTLYGLVKRIVDSLKIDFVTIVNVDIPGGSQSDND